MLEILANLEKRARNFFANALNIVLIVCIVNTVFSVLAYRQALVNKEEIRKIEERAELSHVDIKKKIDHRYFNLTKSAEEIHRVRINTLNGELK